MEPVGPNRENIDFICFTDRDDLVSEGWQIRRIDSMFLGRVRGSRLAKLAPHRYLAEYEQSIYMDNSVSLLRDPSDILEAGLADGSAFACFEHHVRDCLYQEAEEVIYYSMDDEIRVREQVDFYRRNNWPEHAGLFSGNFLLRRHNQPEAARFGEMWLSHVLRYSNRDQLSLPFCADRCGLRIKILKEGRSGQTPFFIWDTKKVRRLPPGFDGDEFLWLNPDLASKGVDPEKYMHDQGFREGRPYLHHRPLMLDMMANRHKSGKGRLRFGRRYYTRIYHPLLWPLRNKTFNLAELASPDEAASAEGLWRDFFPTAVVKILKTAPSMPVDEIVAALDALGNYRVIIVNAALPGLAGLISLILRRLEPGGFFFIEDVAAALRLELIALAGSQAELKFYDAMDYKMPDYGADALAVIRK
jgi:hypothetical protein